MGPVAASKSMHEAKTAASLSTVSFHIAGSADSAGLCSQYRRSCTANKLELAWWTSTYPISVQPARGDSLFSD